MIIIVIIMIMIIITRNKNINYNNNNGNSNNKAGTTINNEQPDIEKSTWILKEDDPKGPSLPWDINLGAKIASA